MYHVVTMAHVLFETLPIPTDAMGCFGSEDVKGKQKLKLCCCNAETMNKVNQASQWTLQRISEEFGAAS
jgi:hypothetical protein